MEVKKPGCPQKGERPPDRENVAVSPNPSWPSYPVHPESRWLCLQLSLALLSQLLPGLWRDPPEWLPTLPTPNHFQRLKLKISPRLTLP